MAGLSNGVVWVPLPPLLLALLCISIFVFPMQDMINSMCCLLQCYLDTMSHTQHTLRWQKTGAMVVVLLLLN